MFNIYRIPHLSPHQVIKHIVDEIILILNALFEWFVYRTHRKANFIVDSWMGQFEIYWVTPIPSIPNGLVELIEWQNLATNLVVAKDYNSHLKKKILNGYIFWEPNHWIACFFIFLILMSNFVHIKYSLLPICLSYLKSQIF